MILVSIDAEPSHKITWEKMEYIASASVPVAWLAFALLYSGRGKWLTRHHLMLLAIVPVITIALTWSNEAQSLSGLTPRLIGMACL
jgi:hypothetical protein